MSDFVRNLQEKEKNNNKRKTDRKALLMFWQFWFTSKAAERGTINYEYITDENRLLERAEQGRRTGCQPFITHRYN